MATNIPADHPRAASLLTRERMKAAVETGLVHMTGLIAHGRGEAFDYLLGEQTGEAAEQAIQQAARVLRAAKRPVLSLNGNVVALAAKEMVALAEAVPAKLEVNLFHHTPERVARLIAAMKQAGAGEVLGADPDTRIPGLASDRGPSESRGIGSADVVLVPLEDGDRCAALKRMGKVVVTVDLNPLSRTARAADVTIVDELTRAIPRLVEVLRSTSADPTPADLDAALAEWDNRANLRAARSEMVATLQRSQE